jgi:hypothetical protein
MRWAPRASACVASPIHASMCFEKHFISLRLLLLLLLLLD